MAHFTLLRTDLAEAPSDWLLKHAHHIKPSGHVLDVAAGSGRNSRWLAQQGFVVEAVDRDRQALESMKGVDKINLRVADIENESWPYTGLRFDAIVVCHYLHRPLLNVIGDSLAPRGVLIYETFMQGHEAYGKPGNPDFLLKPDELLETFQARFEIVAFEQGFQDVPKPSMMQRICVINAC
jgi:SAM-dependent methyltransferase